MYDRGIAVIAVTRRGVETALKIKNALDHAGLGSTVYAPKKYSQNGVAAIDNNLGDLFKDTYRKVDALVGVMATGIIIRAVAPLLESKLTDPAVIGVDVSGKFVISLLSGHLGGANELTRIIAEGISATPVITTASDSMGKLSADELARTLHLSIQNPNSLVAVNSAIINGDRVVVILVDEVKVPLGGLGCFEVKKVQNIKEAHEVLGAYDAGIIITDEPVTAPKFSKPVTILKPKRIVVGLGARKDTPADSIVAAVHAALERVHIPLSRVHCFATVDIKRNSKPMLNAVEKLGAQLEFLSVEALRSVTYDDLSPDSAMVQNKIGIGGVCERAALKIAGPNAKLILKKTKLNGVTVAVAEAE
ncbi:MAG: cobalt-precorrin 5A hydrolase [Candidatus Bathyarchaeota archaeon]|nr:cobalt-precorrin 5A hydrolase [Candidatus Bathyarchaeota archaeon]